MTGMDDMHPDGGQQTEQDTDNSNADIEQNMDVVENDVDGVSNGQQHEGEHEGEHEAENEDAENEEDDDSENDNGAGEDFGAADNADADGVHEEMPIERHEEELDVRTSPMKGAATAEPAAAPDLDQNADATDTNGTAQAADSPHNRSIPSHTQTSNNLRARESGSAPQGYNPMDAALADSMGVHVKRPQRGSQQQTNSVNQKSRPGSGGNSPRSTSNSAGDSPARSPGSDTRIEGIFLRADWRGFEPDNVQVIFREQVRGCYD